MRHHEIDISVLAGVILLVLQGFNLINLPWYAYLIIFLWWILPIFFWSMYVFFYTSHLIKKGEKYGRRY